MFSSVAQQLSASMEYMAKVIGEITATTNDGADGTNDIAEKVVVVTEKASEVMAQAKNIEHSSQILMDLVSRFKI